MSETAPQEDKSSRRRRPVNKKENIEEKPISSNQEVPRVKREYPGFPSTRVGEVGVLGTIARWFFKFKYGFIGEGKDSVTNENVPRIFFPKKSISGFFPRSGYSVTFDIKKDDQNRLYADNVKLTEEGLKAVEEAKKIYAARKAERPEKSQTVEKPKPQPTESKPPKTNKKKAKSNALKSKKVVSKPETDDVAPKPEVSKVEGSEEKKDRRRKTPSNPKVEIKPILDKEKVSDVIKPRNKRTFKPLLLKISNGENVVEVEFKGPRRLGILKKFVCQKIETAGDSMLYYTDGSNLKLLSFVVFRAAKNEISLTLGPKISKGNEEAVSSA